MGIEDKDQELEELTLEEAEPGELVRTPDGDFLPKAGRDKSGRGISGLRPKPSLPRELPANISDHLEVAALQDALENEFDETPTRPDSPVSINAQSGLDSLPVSSIHRPTVLVQPNEEIPMTIPPVVIPPLDDISKFEPDLDGDDDESRHMVTIPDIGAVRFGARNEIARVDELLEQIRTERLRYAREDGSVYVPDEVLEKRRNAPEKPDIHQRTLALLQMTYNYEVAWWSSNNALVRIWGQMNCASQILDREQIIADLKEVLGEQMLIEDHHGEMIPVVWDLNFIITHQPGIRSAIRAKYSKANLDAIIARRTK